MGEILCQGYDISHSGAIICKHVARKGMPILSAQRDEPISDTDTGWQFTCGTRDHVPDDGELWCVASVVNLDASVLKIIDSPTCKAFRRSGSDVPWNEQPYDAD